MVGLLACSESQSWRSELHLWFALLSTSWSSVVVQKTYNFGGGLPGGGGNEMSRTPRIRKSAPASTPQN